MTWEDSSVGWPALQRARFDLEGFEEALVAILAEVEAAPDPPGPDMARVLRAHPLPDGHILSKPQILRGYRQLCKRQRRSPDDVLIGKLRVKPTRTISGVAPVTVLTEPHPCPGHCVFCPDVDQMPKSYLPDEPGAMRAVSHRFDPFAQTASRIAAMQETGHSVDKVELLILGGTWSCYPEHYKEWFVLRCLDALNGVDAADLPEAQHLNETAPHRNVGLVIETRPDWITVEEVQQLRRLGATKVQLGVQSLDDRLLALNRRGHTATDTRRAMRLLRLSGFKIVVHWMPNLLGATPVGDLADFRRLWDDPTLRPDEIKIYPTSLLPDTELYHHWEQGKYGPYNEETLVDLLTQCKVLIPPYCRVNRLMRDIPSPNIVAGVKKTNLRQIVKQHMARQGLTCDCIRCREVRGQVVDPDTLVLHQHTYHTDATREIFLNYQTPEGRLAGFLRLSLPQVEPPIAELADCAMIREVHIYGPALGLGDRQDGTAQHVGLGTGLIDEARRIAGLAGFRKLAVIAAVGTRSYYRQRGFEVDDLYMLSSL